MEEEDWKGLSLPSLYHHHHSSAPTSRLSLNLQDFLDRPLPKRNPPKPINHGFNFLSSDVFAGDSPPPATELRLSTGTADPSPSKKKGLVNERCNGENIEERHKRLMKNRESADRSRARKQAYTKELEKKVSYLKKENAELKTQLKMFSFEGCTQPPKKPTLHRTLTAPF